MADIIKVTTFGVGQGLCNLIEIYDQDTGALACLALADCGSTSKVKKDRTTYVENIENMFQYIIEKAQERLRETGTYYFDAVFLSHQDADHWNLMMELFSRLLDVAKGESISIQDENGICTQYLIGSSDSDQVVICSKREDSLFCRWNISRELESNEGEYRSFSYGRTWNISKKQYLSDYEYIEISYSDENVEGTVGGTYRANNGSITIEYTAEDNDGNKEKASYLNDGDNHYIIFQGKKTEYQLGKMDFITAFEIFLQKIPSVFTKMAYKLLKQNEMFDLKSVDSNIQSGMLVKKAINTVYFGGSDYGPKASSLRAKLSCMAENVVLSIDDEVKICNDRIKFRMVMPFNASFLFDFAIYKKKVPIGISRNRSSLFVIIYYSDGMIILPGDATSHTMNSFCLLSDKRYIEVKGDAQFLVAPHHGSDTTSMDTPSGYQTLNTFLRKIRPRSVAISSGINNRHHHPGENFINKVSVFASNVADQHLIYEYTASEGYVFDVTNKDIRTTVISDEYSDGEYQDITFSNVPVRYRSGRKKIKEKGFRELPRKDLFV